MRRLTHTRWVWITGFAVFGCDAASEGLDSAGTAINSANTTTAPSSSTGPVAPQSPTTSPVTPSNLPSSPPVTHSGETFYESTDSGGRTGPTADTEGSSDTSGGTLVGSSGTSGAEVSSTSSDSAGTSAAPAPEDSLATCSAGATTKAGDFTKTVMVGGQAREFLVHVPASYDGTTPMPIVIDFHPLGGSGASWKGSTPWGAKADDEGFIMVWPTGIGQSWNVGMCCSTARAEQVDDVAFTRAIISSLASDACVDTKRVYASGCSNGGGMAFKVACEAADVIAAVAPVDFDCVVGPTVEDACGSCAPDRPISEIQFRGTNDTAVPFTGGPGPRAEVTFPGADDNLTRWGEINECSGSPEALSENAACKTYPTCGGEAESTLCTVQNGSHCGSYQSFGIVDIAWSRLKAHSL